MIVYTLASVGVLLLAFIVYKKTMQNDPLRKNALLKIKDMMRLPDRKMLYIVECEGEKFLIGSSTNNLNLISKLSKEDRIKDVKEEVLEKSFMISQDGGLLKKLSDRNKEKRGNY